MIRACSQIPTPLNEIASTRRGIDASQNMVWEEVGCLGCKEMVSPIFPTSSIYWENARWKKHARNVLTHDLGVASHAACLYTPQKRSSVIVMEEIWQPSLCCRPGFRSRCGWWGYTFSHDYLFWNTAVLHLLSLSVYSARHHPDIRVFAL